MLRVLRNQIYRRLFTAQIVALLGTGLATVALGLLAYDVAICLNAWCFEPDHSFNITKARALLQGYRRKRALSEAEIAALPILARGSAPEVRAHFESFGIGQAQGPVWVPAAGGRSLQPDLQHLPLPGQPGTQHAPAAADPETAAGSGAADEPGGARPVIPGVVALLSRRHARGIG